MKTNGKFKFPYILVGLGVGAVTALLFRLRRGEDTRKYISERTSKGLNALNQQARKLREGADKIVERGKAFVSRHSDSADTRKEAERQAYEEKKRENLGG
jgi:gas vesicle protein